jgi:succinyl-diaminopimelate desuccinylase
MNNHELHALLNEMCDEIIQLLKRLIQIPSENPPGNYDEICDFLCAALVDYGFHVQVIEVPQELVEQKGLKGSRKNILATLHGESEGKTIILNSHLDTVPVGDHEKWTYAPFSGEIVGNRIYGRGSTDSKGRLVSYIMAALALKRSGVPFSGKIIIAATCDEETGGELGAKYLTENNLLSGDMAIVEGYSNMIVRACAGMMNIKVISYGKSAHSGYKWQGINAIENMATIILELQKLQKELQNETSQVSGMNYTTLNIGLIQGGNKINVVPDYCEIDIDVRIIPEHTLDDIENRLRSTILNAESKNEGMKIEVYRLQTNETEPTIVDENSPLIHALQQASESVNGTKLPVVGVLGQSDARYFIKHGIPSINYGPGTNQNNLHGIDEYMDLNDLINSTKVIALFLHNVLGISNKEEK